MTTKLVLFIGLVFKSSRTECNSHKPRKCRYMFIDDEIVGLATAIIVRPDIIICQRELHLLPVEYVRYKLTSMEKGCRFFIVNTQNISSSKM